MNKWTPQQLVFAVRLAIVLALALVGADMVPTDGWTWDD